MLAVVAFAAFFSIARAYPSGAPPTACDSMTPNHDGVGQQTTLSPYTITFTPNSYSPGQSTQVRIAASDNRAFKGFLLKAREKSTNLTVGTFSTTDGKLVKALSCSGTQNSAATHTSNVAKTEVLLSWTPPQNQVGDIVFIATVVQEKVVFWIQVLSQPLQQAPITTAASTAALTVASTVASTVAPTAAPTAPPTAGVQAPVQSGIFLVTCLALLLN